MSASPTSRTSCATSRSEPPRVYRSKSGSNGGSGRSPEGRSSRWRHSLRWPAMGQRAALECGSGAPNSGGGCPRFWTLPGRLVPVVSTLGPNGRTRITLKQSWLASARASRLCRPGSLVDGLYGGRSLDPRELLPTGRTRPLRRRAAQSSIAPAIESTAAYPSSHVGTICSGGSTNPLPPEGRSSIV